MLLVTSIKVEADVTCPLVENAGIKGLFKPHCERSARTSALLSM